MIRQAQSEQSNQQCRDQREEENPVPPIEKYA
jgi:hypothetical protein